MLWVKLSIQRMMAIIDIELMSSLMFVEFHIYYGLQTGPLLYKIMEKREDVLYLIYGKLYSHLKKRLYTIVQRFTWKH